MLLPKRVKYRRVHRGRMTGKALRGNTVSYGEFGLVATEPAWITSNQIEAARVAMTRYTKRGGQVWIKIFPDKPVKRSLPTGNPSSRRRKMCRRHLPLITMHKKIQSQTRTFPCKRDTRGTRPIDKR